MLKSSMLLRVLGVVYLLLGFLIVLNSFQGITGFVVFGDASIGWGGFLGVVFVLIGVVILFVSGREKEGDLRGSFK